MAFEQPSFQALEHTDRQLLRIFCINHSIKVKIEKVIIVCGRKRAGCCAMLGAMLAML